MEGVPDQCCPGLHNHSECEMSELTYCVCVDVLHTRVRERSESVRRVTSRNPWLVNLLFENERFSSHSSCPMCFIHMFTQDSDSESEETLHFCAANNLHSTDEHT